jgi:hypothetical protein
MKDKAAYNLSCDICDFVAKTPQGIDSHLRGHIRRGDIARVREVTFNSDDFPDDTHTDYDFDIDTQPGKPHPQDYQETD